MTPSGKSRRACALLKVGRGQPARPMVEKRPLFGYWAILMPHFRGVLLPPQNRSDESIQWAWTETADGDAVSSAELTTIRKRLAGAQQSLADSLEDVSGFAAKAATVRATKDRMDEVVGGLVALSDVVLAGFVARTDRGLLLHSWGLANPLPVQYLDADFEMAGRVFVAGALASGEEVLLETVDGMRVARTKTDAEGRFGFSKVATGSYRIRAVSRPPEVLFAEKGEVVELPGSSLANIEIRDEDRERKAVPTLSGTGYSSSRHVRGIVVACAAFVVLAVYCFWPGKGSFANSSVGSESSTWEVNSAPRSVARHSSERAAEPRGRSAQVAVQVNTAAQLTAKTSGSRRSQPDPLSERGHSRAADIVVAQQTSGLPPEQAGLPAGSGGIPGESTGLGAGGAAGGGQAGGHPASPASGSTGIEGGSSSVGRDASTSDRPTASPASPPSSVVSSPAPGNMPPAARPPQGSSTQKDLSSNASIADAKTESSDSAGADPQSANSPAATKAAGVNTGDKAEPSDRKNSASIPSARPVASDQLDLDRPVPEEDGDKMEQERSHVPLGESGDERSPVRNEIIPTQPASGSAGLDSVLMVRTELRSSPWRWLLLRDAIVPTVPTRAGQDDAMSELSVRVLAEKQASVPRTLQDGHMVVGIRIEFPAPTAGPSPHWDTPSGASPLIATVNENAAEIGWRDEAPVGQYILIAGDGHMIASISVDPQKGIRVSSAGMISSWPWVGIECAAGETGRFDWQVLGTASVPSSWTRNNRWMNDRGRRLDMRLSSEKDETVVLSLAIVDAATGWALASKIEHQQRLRR